MAEQNLQKIRHTDQLIFDEDQNLVGIKNPKGHGEDFLPVRLSSDGTSLVSGDGTEISPGGSVSDGDKGDVTVSATGSVWKIKINGSPPTDDAFSGPSTSTHQAGATVAQWDLVYLGPSGKWLLADADAVASCSGMLGLATESGTDTVALSVALPGSYCRNDAWSWTIGGAIYASTTGGGLTQTAPSGTDDVVRVVGFAVTADIVFFMPESGYLVHV